MSRPGFPSFYNRSYSYDGYFFNSTTGVTTNGPHAGSYRRWFRDSTGPNSPNWPVVKPENPYMTYSCEVNDRELRYLFGTSNGSKAWGGDSSAVKAIGSNSTDTVMIWSWPIIEQLYDEALSKLHTRLATSAKSQKVNTAQVFAERRRTESLVVSSINKLADAFMSVRRGNIRHAVRTLVGSSNPRSVGITRSVGGVPEQWLALQYGWKPLLQDIYSSCEEYAERMSNLDPESAACSVYATGSASTSHSFRIPGGPYDPDWDVVLTAAIARGKGRVLYCVDNSALQFSARTGMTNPAQLAWELLPFSFVVDWALPLGSYFSNLDYSLGLDFLRGFEAMKITLAWTGNAVNLNRIPPGFNSGGYLSGGFASTVEYYQRLPLAGFPTVSFPSLKDPFSPTHVANALSLLATAFSSTSRVR